MDKQKDLPLPQTDLPLPEKEISPGAEAKTVSKNKWILFIALALILLIATLFGAYFLGVNNKPKPVACTAEAKICPDGSSVGRTGPKCEFTKCPSVTPTTDTSNWKTYTNPQYGFSFKYPKDWQYQIQKDTSSILKTGVKQTSVNFGIPDTKNEIGETISPTVGPGYVILNLIQYPNTITDIKTYTVDLSAYIAPKWSTMNLQGISAYKVEHSQCQGGPCEDILIVKDNIVFDFSIQNGDEDLNRILSSFKFTGYNTTPTPTCRPRPACLDAKPIRCMIAETSDMCPPTITPSQ